MKRLLMLGVLMLALLALTACSGSKSEPTPPAEPPVETAPAETQKQPLPEEEAEVLRYEVEVLLVEKDWTAEDGTLLLTSSVQIPQLVVLRQDGTAVETAQTAMEEQALAVADAFREGFREWIEETPYNELAATAREELEWIREEGMEWYGNYAFDLTCTVYQTEQMISVSGLHYTYTGGVHPNTSRLGWNFDLTEGTFFGPDLLADGTALQTAVAEEILRQARTPQEGGYVPADWYWEDYETLIADWVSTTVFFDDTGMVVVFSPYELAPYAAGPQEFRFSYDWLHPHLGPHGLELLGLGTAE